MSLSKNSGDPLAGVGELLCSGKSVVLAVIVGSAGSVPRSVGARMALLQDSSIIGTVGGGILEARVLDSARKVLTDRGWVLREFEFSSEDASKAGMICGGRVQILLHYVDASNPHYLELYRAISASVSKNENAWLITRIPEEGDREHPPTQVLYFPESSCSHEQENGRLTEILSGGCMSRPGLVAHGEDRYLVEPLGKRSTVFVFGAGHVSMELVPLCSLVGFRTMVLDDRSEFANTERFPTADQVVVLDSFTSAVDNLEVGEYSYLVLVTRGHMSDLDLLARALRTKAGYIGMIGSRRKRQAVFNSLKQQGFESSDFERVHSPIGLEIGAETPEEIAVSIVAELIRHRARRT